VINAPRQSSLIFSRKGIPYYGEKCDRSYRQLRSYAGYAGGDLHDCLHGYGGELVVQAEGVSGIDTMDVNAIRRHPRHRRDRRLCLRNNFKERQSAFGPGGPGAASGLALGATKVMTQPADTHEVRFGPVANMDAMKKARHPSWVIFLGPFIGAAGVVIGENSSVEGSMTGC
jgi:hypothetical protein